MSLTWRKAINTGSDSNSSRSQDVRSYLLQQDKDELVRLVLEAVERDEGMRNRILLRIANSMASGPDTAAIRAELDRAVEIGRYIEYGEAWGYAEKLHDVVTSIRFLLDSGHAAHVIDLVEYAVELIEDQMEYVDDSDGCVGNVLGDLEQIHQEAYKRSPIDAKDLGERLFEIEMRCDYTFYDAISRYGDILAERGFEAYAARAREAWDYRTSSCRYTGTAAGTAKRWRFCGSGWKLTRPCATLRHSRSTRV
jgi:hypothetical protein